MAQTCAAIMTVCQKLIFAFISYRKMICLLNFDKLNRIIVRNQQLLIRVLGHINNLIQ